MADRVRGGHGGGAGGGGRVLTALALAGLVSLTLRGWRWFGAGLLSGAVACALLDVTWVFGYLVLVEGS